jgi:predicted SAM-dependent methyltransferase
MDCKRLAFRDGIFDNILLVAVLHHLASEETRISALKECWRTLRLGGTLYLSVLSY